MTTTSKKCAIALGLSLGLNLFLLGAVSVHFMARRQHPGLGMERHPGGPAGPRSEGAPAGPRGEDGGPTFLREMVRTLGGPRDPRVQKLWSERRQDMRRYRGEFAQARADVRSALTREPFDQAELEKALRHLHTLNSDAEQHSQEAVLALARQLSAAERKTLAASGPAHSHQ